MAYNLTQVYESNTLVDFFTNMNITAEGSIAAVLILVQFVLIWVVFKQFDTATILLVDSFICSLLSGLMVFGLGWLSFEAFGISLILMFISLIMFGIKKD